MELVAPVADLDKLKLAFLYGADAVYCGLPQFSLRGRKVNKFNIISLKKGIKYANKIGKKVYVTLNIYPHNKQLSAIKQNLIILNKIRPDSVFIADPGIIKLAKKYAPNLSIHLSTQANCLNYEAVAFWKEQGVKRIVLARETSIQEAQIIKKKVPDIELEYFVHGAMCMAYSGRCLLSSWINQRSANQGQCTQPCRWPWKVVSGQSLQIREVVHKKDFGRRKATIELGEENEATYFLNSKDLCLINDLEALEKSGIDCLKIEGRNKSVYYLATVVKYYRKALDSKGKKRKIIIEEALREFAKLGNREYTTGFAFGLEEKIQNYLDSRGKSSFQLVGEIVDSFCFRQKKQLILATLKQLSDFTKKQIIVSCFVHNTIFVQEELEAISPNALTKLKVLKIFNHKGELVDSAHGGTGKIWFLVLDKKLTVGTILRKSLLLS